MRKSGKSLVDRTVGFIRFRSIDLRLVIPLTNDPKEPHIYPLVPLRTHQEKMDYMAASAMIRYTPENEQELVN